MPGQKSAPYLLAIVMLAAVASPVAAFDDAALAHRAYEKIILPGYFTFDTAAHRLVEKADELCTRPSQAALAETREAARATLLAWGRIEPIRFGPIAQKQRMERLLFYPDPHGFVGKQTAKLLAKHDEADIAPDKLAGASVAVQGFGALDVALFGQAADQLATSAPDAAFRCHYVRAIAAGIAQIASEALSEWKGEHGEAWLHPGPENKSYLSARETTQALFRAYVTQLDAIRLQRLATVAGGETKPAGPLLPHSGLGLPFILAGIEGERDILGDNGFTAPDPAPTDKERDAAAMVGSVATDLGFALRAGEAAATMAPDALADPQARARLLPMLLSLKNAEELGRSALGELTGQSLGFNSLDGD